MADDWLSVHFQENGSVLLSGGIMGMLYQTLAQHENDTAFSPAHQIAQILWEIWLQGGLKLNKQK